MTAENKKFTSDGKSYLWRYADAYFDILFIQKKGHLTMIADEKTHFPYRNLTVPRSLPTGGPNKL